MIQTLVQRRLFSIWCWN